MGGVRDVFWEKYFWGLVWPDGTDEIKKASTYICTEMGVPETCFLRNIFGGRGFRPKIALERIGNACSERPAPVPEVLKPKTGRKNDDNFRVMIEVVGQE
jgi:hypothetical protein